MPPSGFELTLLPFCESVQTRGIRCGGGVTVSAFFRRWTPNLKVGGLISHAITSANLDFHCCVSPTHQRAVPLITFLYGVGG